ncbi:MAG: glycosyltransferase family 39 protein [Bacteroidales bacterium]|nr:glycosyltransferase family 39 protein [Bacteroidales bacterium]
MLILFLIISTIFLTYKHENKIMFLLSGIFAGLAFYTKFTILFYILIQLIYFIIFLKKIKFKNILFYYIGILIVFITFSFMGYFSWLTLITGKSIAVIKASIEQNSSIRQISQFLYFGSPFLIIFILGIILKIFRNVTFIEKIVYLSLIFGAFIFIVSTFYYSDFNRYLLVFIIPLFPFFIKIVNKIKITKIESIIILFTNYIILTILIIF